jgi:hypothetical protein
MLAYFKCVMVIEEKNISILLITINRIESCLSQYKNSYYINISKDQIAYIAIIWLITIYSCQQHKMFKGVPFPTLSPQ